MYHYKAELNHYARDEGNIPGWLRERVDRWEVERGPAFKRRIAELEEDFYVLTHVPGSRPPTGGPWPTTTARIKVSTISRYLCGNETVCIGIAADEDRPLSPDFRYPLVEWGVTEKEALAYCLSHGFDWGGGCTSIWTGFRAGAALYKGWIPRGLCARPTPNCGRGSSRWSALAKCSRTRFASTARQRS